MNKTDLIKNVAEDAGVSKIYAEKVLNNFIEVVGDELAEGKKVTVTGFGTFLVSKRKEKMGINPRTKERIKIPAQILPHFRPGKRFKDAIR
ncbi:HU family DNA-binding protein [Patescibacteria group bacterium]|nr:HU family DNA-binding protein [Patescibacteria group bacterium]